MVAKAIKFLKTDIWRMRLKNYPRSKAFFLKPLRIVLLAGRGFDEDKCKFRASALTYFSLLSIVPVIAMMFGIAKGFGLEERVRERIMEGMQGQEEVAERVVNFADSLLKNASGGLVAGIGVAFLFWSIIKVLSNIEHSFNDIWGVKKPRSFGRKLSDYLSMILICPFLMILAGSATVAINDNVQVLIQKVQFLQPIWPIISLLLSLLPYCTLWVAFTFVFIFMPNTKVRFRSAFMAGIVTGTLFQLAQWGYVNFQIGASKYSGIYGSFAALPLFLIWLQISWLIVLFGAELSFAHQNVETYEFEPDCLSVSYSFKKLLTLMITHRIVKNFCDGQKPFNAEDISHDLEIPIRLVRQILFDLVEAGVLIEIKKDETKAVSYQPARGVDQMTIKFVVDSLEHHGDETLPVTQSDQLNKLSECLKEFSEHVANSPSNIVLKDI